MWIVGLRLSGDLVPNPVARRASKLSGTAMGDPAGMGVPDSPDRPGDTRGDRAGGPGEVIDRNTAFRGRDARRAISRGKGGEATKLLQASGDCSG